MNHLSTISLKYESLSTINLFRTKQYSLYCIELFGSVFRCLILDIIFHSKLISYYIANQLYK